MYYKYDVRQGIEKIKLLPTKVKTTLGLMAALTVTAAAVAVPITSAASGGSPASTWHIGYYTPSSYGTLSNAQAPSVSDGVASLNFTNQANTALLVTNQKAKNPGLLGNVLGDTVTANFTVSGAAASDFTYYGQGTASNPCSTPASVRLYFETSNAGGFNYAHYWWSNPASAVLDNGTYTVTTSLDPANWSDWNGQNGSTVSDQFKAAASNVTEIGLSFGGGCFFENGVGTSDGLGTFTLNSYTVE